MKESINLLPKPEKYRTAFLLGLILFVILFSLPLAKGVLGYLDKKDQLQVLEEQVSQLETTKQHLLQELLQQANSNQEYQTTATYLKLIEEIEDLFVESTEIIDTIFAQLPHRSTVLYYDYHVNGKLDLISTFHSVEELSQYIQRIQQYPWVTYIAVVDVSFEEAAPSTTPISADGNVQSDASEELYVNLLLQVSVIGGNDHD